MRLNAIYCGLCYVFPSQQTKLLMALEYHGGKRGEVPDCMTELRVTEVNILQVRACHTFEHLEALSHEIFCN